MPKFHTQEALDAHARTLMNAEQLVTFDQLMATGAWKVNKTMSDPAQRKTVVWFEAKRGAFYVIGLGVDGKIERPLKGKTGVLFNKRTLARAY
jgi:hypothetical protein